MPQDINHVSIDRAPAEDPQRIGAETLFREHAAFVAGFLRRLGVASHAVDDLVQEVFLVAHRKGGYVAGVAQPRTWVAAIALNVARSERRAAQRRDTPESLRIEQAHDHQPDPADALETSRSLARVQAALDTLDADHRATFILYEIEGATTESIAAALSVPAGTVYSRLHHARKRFMHAYAVLADTTSSSNTPRHRTPMENP